MATRPTNRNLLIPGKNALGSDYQKDAQTVEIWARQPIQQLLAGAGITLSPANGLATDGKGHGPNPITISASGGGGGAPAVVTLTAGPDAANAPLNFPLSPMGANLWSTSYWPIWAPPPATLGANSAFNLGCSWFFIFGPGQSVAFLPEIGLPPFSGGSGFPLSGLFAATSLDFSNFAVYYVNKTLLSGGQLAAADFTLAASGGADLSLVAGTGESGNGIVSAAGGIPYIAGFSAVIEVTPGTTF